MSKRLHYWSRCTLVATLAALITFNPAWAGRGLRGWLNHRHACCTPCCSVITHGEVCCTPAPVQCCVPEPTCGCEIVLQDAGDVREVDPPAAVPPGLPSGHWRCFRRAQHCSPEPAAPPVEAPKESGCSRAEAPVVEAPGCRPRAQSLRRRMIFLSQRPSNRNPFHPPSMMSSVNRHKNPRLPTNPWKTTCLPRPRCPLLSQRMICSTHLRLPRMICLLHRGSNSLGR